MRTVAALGSILLHQSSRQLMSWDEEDWICEIKNKQNNSILGVMWSRFLQYSCVPIISLHQTINTVDAFSALWAKSPILFIDAHEYMHISQVNCKLIRQKDMFYDMLIHN